MQNSKTAERFVSRFVAGRTLEDALRACSNLRSEGMLSTLDHLGENVTSVREAADSRDAYLKSLDGIADKQLVSTVSVKLTQMGLDLAGDTARDNARALAERAKSYGTSVEVDMESSEYTDRTLAIVRDLHQRSGNVRAVIQAYLRRSEADIDRLCAEKIPVRLCKGAYKEPAELAFEDKAEVDASYERLMTKLLEEGTYPAIASHDERLVRKAMEQARKRGLGPDHFEFQMLYGIRRDLQKELVRQGFRLRLYVPYGDAWYPYFMRRLAERPANVWFIVKNWMRA
jgi:proline dehydrogenase